MSAYVDTRVIAYSLPPFRSVLIHPSFILDVMQASCASFCV